METILTIDGSQGEGGGQVLRSSLAMSLVTGRPFVIENIRAGRKKPGLMRQHLTAVNAATEVSHAEVDRGRDRIVTARVSAGQGRRRQLRLQRGHGGQHDPGIANGACRCCLLAEAESKLTSKAARTIRSPRPWIS